MSFLTTRGAEALAPNERRGGPVVLSEALLDFFKAEKRADARASVPELIRRARVTEQSCH